MKSVIKVMIIEDSRVISEFLTFLINSDPRLRVVACARSGEEALRLLPEYQPDVISLDIRLPGMNGLELTTRIMSEYPTPIVVVASDVDDEALKISMHALKAGALAVVEKPVGLSHRDYQAIADSLCTKLVIMSEVRVIRQRFRSTLHDRKSSYQPINLDGLRALPPAVPMKLEVPVQLIGICASTGGPSALLELLQGLSPKPLPPVLLVQHITPSFTESFTQWLQESLPMHRVQIAKHGEKPVAGNIYVAPAECHLEIHPRTRTMLLSDSPPVSSQKPSGTKLFHSLAYAYGPSSLGVILTGMGDDGASGLKTMRDVGAYTIAEDESTAIVFGMPKVARELDAVTESLPLPQIAKRVNQLLTQPVDSAS